MVEIDGCSNSPALYSTRDDELTLPLLYGKEELISFELSKRATFCFYGDLKGDLPGDLEFNLWFYSSIMSLFNGIRNWCTLMLGFGFPAR